MDDINMYHSYVLFNPEFMAKKLRAPTISIHFFDQKPPFSYGHVGHPQAFRRRTPPGNISAKMGSKGCHCFSCQNKHQFWGPRGSFKKIIQKSLALTH